MKRRVNFFAIIILIISVSFEVNAEEDEHPAYTRYVDEVTHDFLRQVKKEFGFECEGSGGEMPYDVEEISVQLVAYQNATVEQARELEIKLTEKFVQVINAHEKIKPFLRESPFPSNRAHVSISFQNPSKKKAPPADENVTFVFQAKDRIYYQAKNPDNPYVYKDIKDEPYEEALKIVQRNTSRSFLLKAKSS